jgi:hypothetical protein
MDQECIYCGRKLPGERLSQGANGWVCTDSEECLDFQDSDSVRESTQASDPEEWIKEIQKGLTETERLLIVITGWDYSVSGEGPLSMRLMWEGWCTMPEPDDQRIQADGDFVPMDKASVEDWSDHPFKVGEVHQNVDSLSVTIRVNETYYDEIRKALTVGFSLHDNGRVYLELYLKGLSESERINLEDSGYPFMAKPVNNEEGSLFRVDRYSIKVSTAKEQQE